MQSGTVFCLSPQQYFGYHHNRIFVIMLNRRFFIESVMLNTQLSTRAHKTTQLHKAGQPRYVQHIVNES
jgi:hypothetical protein